MNDGIYTVSVTLSGGTGRASVTSPMTLTVKSGEMTARVEWSSPNYDLMIVDGKDFLPVNQSGNSVFEIPVYTLDEPLSVQAETVAMSEPHLIDYVITFDSKTLTSGDMTLPLVIGGSVLGTVVIAGTVFAVIKTRKRKL